MREVTFSRKAPSALPQKRKSSLSESTRLLGKTNADSRQPILLSGNMEKRDALPDPGGHPVCFMTGGKAGRIYFIACATATATSTEAPTIGLLPMPMSPIISTCAGTEEEPANCASECILPIVSVIP